MVKMKENFELLGLVLAIFFIIILFFSLFIQIPILSQVIRYQAIEAPISTLTKQELDEICFGEPCNYAYKINFDHHFVKVQKESIQFTDTVWAFYNFEENKKVFRGYSPFLYAYLVFDSFALLYIISLYSYLKNERKKENPGEVKKQNRLFRVTSKKKKVEPTEEDDAPLPPFAKVFILGFVQFSLCLVCAYLLAKYFPAEEFSFFLGMLIPIFSGILFYYLFSRRLGFVMSTILCLAPAITGRDILYIENLLNPAVHESKETVFTLEPGKLNRNFTGLYVSIQASGSKSRSKSYTYHYVAPYQNIQEPDSFVQWLALKQEWMEDETKYQIFFDRWMQNRLAVQIYAENTMYAITKAGERYKLDLSPGVALLKPIISLDEELKSSFWKAFLPNAIALFLWIVFGSMRIYAGKKDKL
jgi:hypothetical protein